MERDVALFRRTKNMVEPRFRVQCRGEALVARCRRYSAMLSELRVTIVTMTEPDETELDETEAWVSRRIDEAD